ncbi:HAD hydrolase-like protein [archaeon]|nr:HAD hydrolase-like protein [archaeon]
MFKTIFFDGNGVIYERDKSYCNDFFKEMGEKSGFKNTKEAFDLLNEGCKRGRYSRVEVFKKLLQITGLNGDAVKLEKEYFKLKAGSTSVIKEARPVIKELKEKGLKLGIMSNSNFSGKERGEWLINNGVNEFDHVFTSSDFKATKLSPEFPLKAVKKIKCKTKEAILVSHKLSDFIGAMLIGMDTMSIGVKLSTTYNVKSIKLIPSLLIKENLI